MEQSKKDCILDEAAIAFARFGFKKASVDEIARAAGVAKGTVYLAVESKQDLFYQVLHREVRAWVAECARAIDPRVPADELIALVLRNGVEYLERRPLVRELLFGRIHELLPEWGPRFDALRELGRANLVEILRLGVRQSVFREDLEVDTVASLMQDLTVGAFVFHGRDVAGRANLLDRARIGLDLLLNGLRRRPA